MIDVTWASGYTDKLVKKFTPEFSDTYFFTDPYRFLLNHYPELATWRPVRSRLSKKAFFKNPTILEDYFQLEVNSFSPQRGIIKTKQKEPVDFYLSLVQDSTIKEVVIVIGEEKRAQVVKPEFILKNRALSFSLSYDKMGSYPLTIYINERPVLKYQLIVEEGSSKPNLKNSSNSIKW